MIATQGPDTATRRGRHAIKVLDALIHRDLGDDDNPIAGWTSARQFRASPVGAAVAAPVAAVTAPATTTTATATTAAAATKAAKRRLLETWQ